jgi:hypothetical protein
MRDKELNNRTIKAGLKNSANMFQNVRGNFYSGVEIKNIPEYVKKFLPFRAIILSAVRRITTGLTQGASDNIGFTVVNTDDLPPHTCVAVFTAIENKQEGEPFREGQREFLAMTAEAGGIAGVNRDGVFEWYSEIKWREV